MNPQRSTDRPAPEAPDLEALQRQVWLAKIARSRAMTPDERFAEVVSLTTQAFDRMHAAAMADLGTTDSASGWLEVRRRLERIRAARDAGRFVTQPLADSPDAR